VPHSGLQEAAFRGTLSSAAHYAEGSVLSSEGPLPFLRETLLFLSLAGLLIPLLQRFRINQVLAFLVVGTCVGPYGIGRLAQQIPALEWATFSHPQDLSPLAELGVVFLMFVIGLELSAPRVWALRRWMFGVGLSQFLLSALVIGTIARAFGNSLEASVALGGVLSLSSTAVVMQLLTQRRALNRQTGQAAFAVLTLQDLAVVPQLILITALAGGARTGLPGPLALALLKSAAVIAMIYVLGRRVARPLFHFFVRHRQPDVFMALTILTALSTATVTAAAGLSMALGAFLAGLLLAETEFQHEVEVTIEPFKGLLLGLFFMTVGFGIDPGEVMRHPIWLVASVVGLFTVKTLIAAPIFRAGGLTWGQAIETALMLGQGGEFAFVIVASAMSAGLLSTDTGQFMLLVVSASLLATPGVVQVAHALSARIDHRGGIHGSDAPGEPLAGHIILAGCGSMGQLLADAFTRGRLHFVAIEEDARLVKSLRARSLPVYYGNASRPEMLRKFHADRAAAVIITLRQATAALRMVNAIREEFPHLPVFAHSNDEAHARALLEAGATGVGSATLEASMVLANLALLELGVPDSEVAALLKEERERRLGARVALDGSHVSA
jgi:monovalent cation:H+ antiporter-2, CPA2 family